MTKIKFAFLILAIFFTIFSSISSVKYVNATSRMLVVPNDFSTIQEAIYAASDGDTVFVKSGMYNESLLIDRSISIFGENPKQTTIMGDFKLNGTVVLIQNDNVNFTGFTVQPAAYSFSRKGIHLLQVSDCNIFGNIFLNNGEGIWLYGSSNNNITKNTVIGPKSRSFGISIDYSPNNLIVENKITENYDGINIQQSNNNTVLNNTIINNSDVGLYIGSNGNLVSENIIKNHRNGLVLAGKNNILRSNKIINSSTNFDIVNNDIKTMSEYINDVDKSNTINGLPIIYWINRQNEKVPEEAQIVVLVNCTNITVEQLYLSKNKQGIILISVTNCTINRNKIEDTSFGILVYASTNNKITENVFFDIGSGIRLSSSENNMVFGNSIRYASRAIILDLSNENIINNNSISGESHQAVVLDGSNKNQLFYNLISDARQSGIFIWNHASQNLIYLNNFVNNTQHVEKYITDMQKFPTNIWDNGTRGNYWENYVATDNNGDGIADSPYVIEENNKDNFPILNPVDIEKIPEFEKWVILVIFEVTTFVLAFKNKLRKNLNFIIEK